MFLAGQLILFFISLYIFAVFWVIKNVSLRKDYLLFVIFLLSDIYLFFAPIYNELLDHELKQDIYFKILVYVVFFFQLPLLVLYSFKKNKISLTGESVTRIKSKERMYAAFCLCFALAFYLVSIPNSLFYGRDSVFNPELKFRLNFFQFLIYRSYIEYSPIVILLTTYLILKFGFKKYTAFFRFSYVVYLLSYLIFIIVNSRLGLLVFFLQFVGMFFLLGIKRKFSKKVYLLGALSLLFVWYGYNVILNIRSNIDDEGFQLSYLNPFVFNINSGASEALNTRLDGVYLMAKMTPSAQEKGYALGKAWGVPLFLSIAPILYPQQAQAIKSSYLTDSESYLLLTYTDLANSTMDFNSVLLTDLYCNFSFWGFLLGAFFVGLVIIYSKRNIVQPKSKLSLILAFFFYTKIMIFESEAISIPLKLFKFFPLFFILLWIFPATKKTETTYDDNNDNPDI